MQFRVTDKDASAEFPIEPIDLQCGERDVKYMSWPRMANEAFPEAHIFLNSSFTEVKLSRVNVDIHSMMKSRKAVSISHMSPGIGNWWASNSGKLLIVLLPSFIITRSSGKNY
jgi:hypothetical protein